MDEIPLQLKLTVCLHLNLTVVVLLQIQNAVLEYRAKTTTKCGTVQIHLELTVVHYLDQDLMR